MDALLTEAPELVPDILENLAPYREEFVPELRKHFHNVYADHPRARRRAFALAAFDEPKGNLLCDSMASAAPSEAPNFLAALEHDQPAALERLAGQLRTAADPRHKTRLAATALYLGDPGSARSLLALGPDRVARTAFIHGLRSWHGDLARLPLAGSPKRK
jgi:hypothetical protein